MIQIIIIVFTKKKVLIMEIKIFNYLCKLNLDIMVVDKKDIEHYIIL